MFSSLFTYFYRKKSAASKKKNASKKRQRNDSDASDDDEDEPLDEDSSNENTDNADEQQQSVDNDDPEEATSRPTTKKLPRFYPGCKNVLPTDWQFDPDIPEVYLSVTGYIFPPERTETISGVKMYPGNDEFVRVTEDTSNLITNANYDVEASH